MKDKILAALENSDGFISGGELSKPLGVSRTAVWKYIRNLREEGYVIDSVTNRGYCMREKPALLDAQIIRNSIPARIVGREVVVLKSVDSTNEELKRRARDGAISGIVVASESQTGGKGRLGRSWKSDPGGLFFSLLLRPELPPAELSSITLAAGLAVCLAVREYTGLDARIKWPNDIIIGNKKLCGILTEMAAQSDIIEYVIIGIGINVNNREFPEEIRAKTVSLREQTGKLIDRNDFFVAVLKHLDEEAASFISGFSADEFRQISELCATIGRRVSASRGDSRIEGTAESISSSGELEVRDDSGKLHRISSGEVVVQGIY